MAVWHLNQHHKPLEYQIHRLRAKLDLLETEVNTYIDFDYRNSQKVT